MSGFPVIPVRRRLLFFLFGLFLLVLSDDLLLDIRRDRLIMAQFHRIAALAAGNAFELAVILRHFRQRHLCLEHHHIAREHFLPVHAAASARQIAGDIDPYNRRGW